MLKNITLSNRCFLPIPEGKLKSIHNKEAKVYDSSIGPIRVQSRKYSLDTTIGNNDLVVSLDDKNYVCSSLNAIFSPGRIPTKFKLNDLEEITWESKEVENNAYATTLEIKSKDPTTFLQRVKDENTVLSGWDIGPIKINDFIMHYINSLELFTEDGILKAKMIFPIDYIKFIGVNVETEATYYVKPN